uniref:TPR_REGION domain-containing protein n=1 Tax=Caenorhabditis tropicalis TaxID=1561998 RepID=A0A1I7T1P2_9PELO
MSEAAIAEKDLGNAAYKSKDFAAALAHYDKAIELDPTNITFYNNKAAVYFEEKKFEECVQECEKAVEIGRETRADYKLIAKAMSRAGNAFQKQGDVEKALHWFQRSLSEFRDPELVKKVKELEKQLKEAERLAYINPQLAQEEKNKGNELFNQGDYLTAKRHYDEAVKRDPENAVLYSNRAACLTRLMEFQRALEDCDTCIMKDPNIPTPYEIKLRIYLDLDQIGHAGRITQICDQRNVSTSIILQYRSELQQKERMIQNKLPPIWQVINQQRVGFDAFIHTIKPTRRVEVSGLNKSWKQAEYKQWIQGYVDNSDFKIVSFERLSVFETYGVMVVIKNKNKAIDFARRLYELGFEFKFEPHMPSGEQHYICQYCSDVITSMFAFSLHRPVCPVTPVSTNEGLNKDIEYSAFDVSFRHD